ADERPEEEGLLHEPAGQDEGPESDEQVVGYGTRHAPVGAERAWRQRQVGDEDEVVVQRVAGSERGPEHEQAEDEPDDAPDGPGPGPRTRGAHQRDRWKASTSVKACPIATHWAPRSWWVTTWRRLAAPTSARRPRSERWCTMPSARASAESSTRWFGGCTASSLVPHRVVTIG